MAEDQLVLEIPEQELWRAIAQEGALADADLDALERRLVDETEDPGIRAALALTIARAGRTHSGAALAQARRTLTSQQRPREALALGLALELLAIPPSPRVERADRGYRYTEPLTAHVLYVEDAVAAHWHRLDRWGPPLRPDPARSPWLAKGPGQVEAALERALAGETVMVVHQPRPFGAPEPPVRITRAGLARDARLTLRCRWSEVRSVGFVSRRRRRAVAFEARGEPVVILPERLSVPDDDLSALITRLIEVARR